jgi:signal transduction histidine kinase
VFSPGELEYKPAILDFVHGELIVPLIKDAQPFGFFICGPKKSEKSYSMQDIRVLLLIAKRVIALFHTASLYQKDLDRQLMLERERARISQDMHDDVGASLTRISMMSDLVKTRNDVGSGARQWLGQISDTSRGLMEEMNQIIWALNPKNDNLEGLVAYVRRFAFEYLEPTAVACVFDLPEIRPDRALSVEVRRNVYLVVREAIHNVVKHAGATNVIISLTPHPPLLEEKGTQEERSLTADHFIITIRDNGKGFDSDKLEFPGNGLVNMKKRMNDIGGDLLIRSKAGEGTEIKLVVHG